jgi:hypothetical protein
VLIERVWRLRLARAGRILSCGTYLHPHGIEVRCGYDNEENLLRSQVVKLPQAAKALAQDWNEISRERGFEEVEQRELKSEGPETA